MHEKDSIGGSLIETGHIYRLFPGSSRIIHYPNYSYNKCFLGSLCVSCPIVLSENMIVLLFKGEIKEPSIHGDLLTSQVLGPWG